MPNGVLFFIYRTLILHIFDTLIVLCCHTKQDNITKSQYPFRYIKFAS